MAAVLVTGGKGTLGRQLVPLLVAAGHQVTLGTRRPGRRTEVREVRLDLAGGDGLGEAVSGQQVVVHLASDATAARRVDVEGTKRLLAACRAAGVAHLIYISIVGVDANPFGYYRAKLAAEQLVEDSGIPYTILRTTQFHDFLARIAEALAPSPVVPVVRGIRLQPVDVEVVARHLAAAVEEGPQGRLPDLGGRQQVELDQAIRQYLRATARRRLYLPLPLWGPTVRAFRSGTVLTPNATGEGRSWSEYLREVGSRRRPLPTAHLTVVRWLVALLGAVMLLAPAAFQRQVGLFGALNPHLIRDLSTFNLPLGLTLIVAAWKKDWRTPLLVFAFLQNTLHLFNHIADADLAQPAWLGPANVASLAALEMLLVLLLRIDRAPFRRRSPVKAAGTT